MPDSRATIFLLDGARTDVISYLADRGDLPNICRLVLEPGGMTPCTTVFPSTTGVAYLPFLTGCYPGTCDVPGIRWLDRRRYGGNWLRDGEYFRNYCGYQGGKLNSDLPPNLRSFFDIESDSIAICTPFNRGLPRDRDLVRFSRAVWGGLAHYTAGYIVLDWAIEYALPRVARRRPRLAWVVLPAIDGVTHHHDPWHGDVLEAYRRADRMLGDYARRGGMDGDHLTVLASDHGMTAVDWHADISLAFESRGLPVLRHPNLWRRNPLLAVAVSGNASAQVYMRPGLKRAGPWSLPEIESGEVPGIPADLVDFILSLDGVALVAGRDGEDIVVRSRDGKARLTPLDGDQIRYTPLTADVLHLGARAMTLPERLWLAASFSGRYPDAPMQLAQLFRSPRAGDLAVTAEPGADLRLEWEIPEHRSGHGGLVGEHMRCLLATNRPLVGPVRTVDVFPLVLEHLGHQIPAGIDGILPPAQDAAREVA